jgi:hypothetical protein
MIMRSRKHSTHRSTISSKSSESQLIHIVLEAELSKMHSPKESSSVGSPMSNQKMMEFVDSAIYLVDDVTLKRDPSGGIKKKL